MTAGVLLIVGPVITSLAAVVAANNGGVPLSDDIKSFTAFAMAGASLGVVFSWCLLDQQEKRKQTGARIIVGALLGVGIPRGSQKYFHWIRDALNDPILVIIAGFICAFAGYFLAYAFFRTVAKKDQVIADAGVKAVERAANVKFESGAKTKEGKDVSDNR